MRSLLSLVLCLLAAALHAQTAGVPVYQEGRGARGEAALMEKAKALLEAKELKRLEAFDAEAARTTCELALPAADTKPLSGRERWQRARAAHLRVGFYYLCTKCDKWHLNLAGGFAITADGVAATCAHVLAAPEKMKEGYLLAVTDDEVVLPVTEILALNAGTDCGIFRVKSPAPLTPLPLGLDVSPGDDVWCFSDPSGKNGYYSEGIVSRFVQRTFLRKKERATLPAGVDAPRPVWLETTLDWAPGSSGSALLDACGNCIGHVSEIQAVLEDPPLRARANAAPPALGTYIVFHQAIAAKELKALIRSK